MKVNFMSSKDNGNKRLMNSKSDNKEIMIDNEVDEIMNQIFSSLLHRYYIDLEDSIKESDFFFDYIDGLHHKCNNTSLNWGRSYIDSLTWLKNKKATINPKDQTENICFKYAVTVALNHEKTEIDLQRITA